MGSDVGHSNTHRNHMAHVVERLEYRILDFVADYLADNLAFRGTGLGQEYAKFLAADAPDQILLAQGLAEHPAKQNERPIPDRMTKIVVDLLEMVDIDNHQYARPFSHAHPFELIEETVPAQ